MNNINFKYQIYNAVKFSKSKFYHHKSSCKLENMLTTVPQNIFLSGLLNYLSNKVFQIKSFSYNNLLRQPSFPRILQITLIIKLTSVSLFIIISFLSYFCNTISSFYYNVLQYVCKTFLIKRKVTQNEHITSM